MHSDFIVNVGPMAIVFTEEFRMSLEDRGYVLGKFRAQL